MGLIEKILCKVFPYTDITRDDNGDIYLRRWFLYPRDKDFGKNKSKKRLYLHRFYRGDEDLHVHDHPWAFTSLLLSRGYYEETPCTQLLDLHFLTHKGNPAIEYYQREGGLFRKIFYPRFSILKRPATWKHRVILKDNKPVWTVVRTGTKERGWGFWIGDKKCPWRQYDNGNCLVESKTGMEEFE